jgi:signal transduction histidine kinase
MTENLHRLLARQVRKHLQEPISPEVQQLLSAINESYEHYDRDRQLLDRAMELSSAELLDKNEELNEKNMALDSFVYRVSHDLRSPANNIHSMVRMLRELLDPQQLSPMQSKVLANLEKSCETLDERLKNLLDMTRIEKRQDEMLLELPLAGLVEEAGMALRQEITRSGAVLDLQCSGFDSLIMGKENALSLFTNLISNAIKYRSPDRPPLIRIATSIEQGQAVMTVSDNGMGMDLEKDGQRLFGMFNRLHNHVEGSGVGLYLVKKILEANNATIRVESSVGKGTTFVILLPHDRIHNKAWFGSPR